MMSYYLLTVGSKAPKISYRRSKPRLFTTSLPPANDEGEFKFINFIDLFKQVFKEEVIDYAKWLIEHLLNIF